MHTLPAKQRDIRLDFFRGLALWLIFIDHIPTSILNRYTIRNYGFSDAAEIFVFISGYAAAIAYSRAMRDQGFLVGTARILRRAGQLYVAFVFLLAVYFAQIAYLARTFENPLFAEEDVTELLGAPDAFLLRALILQFNLANMDILPVYIVLLLLFPPMLWLLLRAPFVALAVSFLFYIAAGLFDLNLPSYPTGEWVINPFRWQLLFVFGAWCATCGAQQLARVIHSNLTLALAIGYLLLAYATVVTWSYPWLFNLKPVWIHTLLYPIDKTNLDPFRFAHILAYVVLVARFVPPDWAGFQSVLARPAILCGRNSLEIFCLSVFLSFAGHFLITELHGRIITQVLVSLAGIALMVGVAAWIELLRRAEFEQDGGRRISNSDIAGGFA
jgi:hypothetical protein